MSASKDEKGLVLLDHPVSSFAQKIRIALREKNLPFQSKVPDGLLAGKHDAAFEAANPRAEVPVLIDGDVKVFDSTVILEYLEDKFPTPALLPAEGAAARAQARLIEDVMDTHYEAMNWGYGEVLWFERASGTLADKLKTQAQHHTQLLQAWLTEQLGNKEWLSGSKFGWADIAAVPVVNRSVYYGLGPTSGSALSNWLARAIERPSVSETLNEFEQAAPNMLKAKDAYKSGERKREYRDHRLEWMVKSGGIDVVVDGIKNRNIRFSWPGEAQYDQI